MSPKHPFNPCIYDSYQDARKKIRRNLEEEEEVTSSTLLAEVGTAKTYVRIAEAVPNF